MEAVQNAEAACAKPDSVFTLFFEGDHYFSSLRDAIRNATLSVDIEIYTIGSDDIGWAFVKLLTAKAKQGVKIRVIYDSFGCKNTSSKLINALSVDGIEVKPYNPITQFTQMWRRNHRKIIIIDSKTVFLGGYNLAAEYSRRCSGPEGWRDTGISCEDANIAKEAHDLFAISWKGNFSPRRFVSRGMHRLKRVRESEGPCLIANHGWGLKSLIRHTYLWAIAQAKKQAWITNSYFVPDQGILRAMARAVKRGVDVRLLTAGSKTDVRTARWAGQGTYAFLLKRGVRIYEYQPRMIHAKTAVVDGAWFTLGTSNLDHLSFFNLLEVNIVGRNPTAGKFLADQFEEDLKSAKEITWADWKKRPFYLNWFNYFFYYFRSWL